MQSGIFKLDLKDVAKGLVTAVFTGAIIALASLVQQPDFNVFEVDWSHIINVAVNGSVVTFFGYLAKNLISDDEGRVLGKIG